MICVTQGHERSISIEVFLKSALQLSKKELSKILFFVNKDSLEKNIKKLSWEYSIDKNTLNIFNLSLDCVFVKDNISNSTDCLLSAINHLEQNGGVLFTLPTSKDQIFLNNKQLNGHTEFFRNFFENKNISMAFSGPIFSTLLITDHIELKDVSLTITPELIIDKTSLFLSHFNKFSNICFSGINPHAGENGSLGTEDRCITAAINTLSKKYPEINFKGPFSGDTLHRQIDSQTLLVYMFHDQGLAPYKIANGLYGSNISLGLPFLRFSPDHGTAFELYGKNIASPYGCLHSLREALKYHG